MKIPQITKIPQVLQKHGDQRIDSYYWLKDRDSEPVLDYLKEENKYAQSYFENWSSCENLLYDEMTRRIPATEEFAPWFDQGYWYFKLYQPNCEYPIFLRSQRLVSNDKETILDVNILAHGHSYHDLGHFKLSPNQRYLAYSEDLEGRRKYSITIINYDTKEKICVISKDCNSYFCWSENSESIYFLIKDETLREYQLYKHSIIEPNAESTLLYEEEDDTYYLSLSKSTSNKYILIESASTLQTEIRYIDAGSPNHQLNLFCKRRPRHEYEVDHYADQWIVRSNLIHDNFSIFTTSESMTDPNQWVEIISGETGKFIEEFLINKSAILTIEWHSGRKRLRIHPFMRTEYYFPFEEICYSINFYINTDPETELIYIKFSSLKTPARVLQLNINTNESKIFWNQQLNFSYDPGNYICQYQEALTSDGYYVPISIIYHKDVILNGENPLLLYGYGSYGIPIETNFSVARLSLLERGFIFAIAHIRGGQEKGREWYEMGKMLYKKNTFHDYICCAHYLIEEKYTNPHLLFAYGGSAGGMLMGVVANWYPSLFKGIIAVVPFVDVLTTMLDESIPLTTGEYDEWGNPNQEEFYNYIKSYSPYDNIAKHDYPNMYIRTGYHDSQVQYWEPAKWTAKLREFHTGTHIILFQCDMSSGHSGSSGRLKKFKEISRDYTFLFSLLNLKID